MSRNAEQPAHRIFDLAAAVDGGPDLQDARLAFCVVGAFRDQLMLLRLNTTLDRRTKAVS